MTKIDEEKLGTPDIRIAGLQIWIHGYQYAEAENEHDANWLRVSAHCGASGASVWVSGSILSTYDIKELASASEKMYQNQIKEIEVDPMEPGLHLAIKTTDSCGHLELTVEITPDHLFQQHSFQFEIDQSYLPPIEAQCKKILDRFPVFSGPVARTSRDRSLCHALRPVPWHLHVLRQIEQGPCP